MADGVCPFIWYELLTTDKAAAGDFYTAVVGWSAAASDMSDVDYTVFSRDGVPGAGMLEITAEMDGARPAWVGYIDVPDVDDYTGRVKAAGGSVHRDPTDIPNVGRFSIVADPHGAVFALFKGDGAPPPGMDDTMRLGGFGWRELMAGDLETAFAFYSGLFGWEKLQAMDMGEMGVYQIFGVGEEMMGGMMTKPAMVPAPYWGYYANVASIAKAVETINARGGQVINGPMEVPGGQWIVQAMDPQGVFFALVGAKQ